MLFHGRTFALLQHRRQCCELTHANPSDSAWLLLPYDEGIVGENDYFTNLMLRTLL